MELPRRHSSHLGRNPPAEAEPDQRCAVGAEIGKQPLIGDGDIAHAAQPLRPLGSAVAWMVRNDHLEAAGQRVIKVELLRGTGVVVQDNHRTPAAGSREMQLHLAQFDKRLAPACPPRHHLSSRYPGHSNLALRSQPRQPTVCSLQGCKLVSIRDDQYILSKNFPFLVPSPYFFPRSAILFLMRTSQSRALGGKWNRVIEKITLLNRVMEEDRQRR